MEKHLAAIAFLMCRRRCVQCYRGNFSVATLHSFKSVN